MAVKAFFSSHHRPSCKFCFSRTSVLLRCCNTGCFVIILEEYCIAIKLGLKLNSEGEAF